MKNSSKKNLFEKNNKYKNSSDSKSNSKNINSSKKNNRFSLKSSKNKGVNNFNSLNKNNFSTLKTSKLVAKLTLLIANPVQNFASYFQWQKPFKILFLTTKGNSQSLSKSSMSELC